MSKVKMEVPITVSVSMGATVNIGNYESRRITVGVSYPVDDKKKLGIVMKNIKKYVKDELEKEIEKLKKEQEINKLAEDDVEMLEVM